MVVVQEDSKNKKVCGRFIHERITARCLASKYIMMGEHPTDSNAMQLHAHIRFLTNLTTHGH